MASGAGPRLFEAASHAKAYLRFRPTYPSSVMKTIISFLSEKCAPPFNLAVDIGCGSGQSSRYLAPHFKEVVGLDVSEAQVQQARESTSESNITYRTGRAEDLPFPDHSIDLITCAQSLHWTDAPKLFEEAKRALKRNGCLVAYGYNRHWVHVEGHEAVQEAMQEEYQKIFGEYLHPFWDERRRLVDTCFQDVHFPFTEFKRDDSLLMRTSMTVDDMIGYMETWSSFQLYIQKYPEKKDFLVPHRQKFLELLQPTNPELPAEQIQFELVSPIFILMSRDTME